MFTNECLDTFRKRYPLATWPWRRSEQWARKQLERVVLEGDRYAKLLTESQSHDPREVWRMVCVQQRHNLTLGLDPNGQIACWVHTGSDDVLRNNPATSTKELRKFDGWFFGRSIWTQAFDALDVTARFLIRIGAIICLLMLPAAALVGGALLIIPESAQDHWYVGVGMIAGCFALLVAAGYVIWWYELFDD